MGVVFYREEVVRVLILYLEWWIDKKIQYVFSSCPHLARGAQSVAVRGDRRDAALVLSRCAVGAGAASAVFAGGAAGSGALIGSGVTSSDPTLSAVWISAESARLARSADVAREAEVVVVEDEEV